MASSSNRNKRRAHVGELAPEEPRVADRAERRLGDAVLAPGAWASRCDQRGETYVGATAPSSVMTRVHSPLTMSPPMRISTLPPMMLMVRMCRFSHPTDPVTQLRPSATRRNGTPRPDAVEQPERAPRARRSAVEAERGNRDEGRADAGDPAEAEDDAEQRRTGQPGGRPATSV